MEPMPSLTVASGLQVVLAFGLLNVWLLRAGASTRYRGGAAQSLRAEFTAYGLSPAFFLLIGVLKVGSAVMLLLGLWVPTLVLPAAGLVVALMLGALAMHVKVKDPAIRSLPAFLMLAMSASLCALSVA